MIIYNWNFITGVSVGFEYLTDKDLEEESEGWTFILDLLIVRLMFQKLTGGTRNLTSTIAL